MTNHPSGETHDEDPEDSGMTRRQFLALGTAAVAVTMVPPFARGQATPAAELPAVAVATEPVFLSEVAFSVNGTARKLELDTRTTLLDTLREHLHLTGSKKGCDHGQCGSCTVMVNGERINSCLSLAVMHQGDEITTIEGLGTPEKLHPMQAAFIKCDGFQCGYCTPGQICSAVAMLKEVKAGIPSHVTADLTAAPQLTPDELRERLSGNICRCGAYSNIIEAVTQVAGETASV